MQLGTAGASKNSVTMNNARMEAANFGVTGK